MSFSLTLALRFLKSKRFGPLARFISMASTMGICTGVCALIIGLSAMNGFEYELHMAQTNYLISGGELETVFLPTDLEYSYLSSTTVREIASFKGDVSKFVPQSIADALYKKFGY